MMLAGYDKVLSKAKNTSRCLECVFGHWGVTNPYPHL